MESLSSFPPVMQLCLGGVLLCVVLAFVRYQRRDRRKQARPVPQHLLQFPPWRRRVLGSPSALEKFSLVSDVPPEVIHARALPRTRAQDLSKDDQYTPTGFSAQEVRALGRFPDYASLSGVRDPNSVSAEFDISTATFRPFRPFRWNYHQTMSLMKFDPDWWVELEKNYHSTMAARQELLKTHGEHVMFEYPGSELACRELMEMVLQFMTKRYPQYFALTNNNTVFINQLLDTSTPLPTTPPLKVIFDNVPEDYALMLRSEEDGLYYLRAAMVCSSVGWDIGQHRNKPLTEIHAHVPDFKDKMAFSMDRFFAKLPTDQPIQRCSWSLEDHAPLFSSPEVVADWTRSAFADRPEELRVEDLRLRCDWQTLRRLPLSGAVVFNFKAVFSPFTELREEPYIPALLGKVLAEGKENLITYKCVDHVRRVAMAALELWAREQVGAGVVPKDWEVSTLDESPFFPGWEGIWKARQVRARQEL